MNLIFFMYFCNSDMIDKATINRIMDAADIVDVVSEFVTLRKSGANYKGLCPFHNERTPSFYVTPARNICHCFGCGKGGNPVGFIMEHEQMTYPEALRWLANRYHIEIREGEQTEQEREAENDRESMYIVNERVAKYFEDILHNHVDGLAIGMQYLRSRGFRDDTIKKFRLGYDLSQGETLPNLLLKEGYKEKYLLTDENTGVGTGICYKRERDGQLIDRFAGRVVFPWIGLNGKVVGFNARKLDQATKGVQQKYVNSPASTLYHKDRELYGIYQAKKAIYKEGCVFIVEGQTDVIAMHQCGIENVVAGSGTAFSVHQTRTLRRFTNNIILIYDNDDAGKHAAMERIDMMLPEGINLKLLFLPEGEDPDSFARKHTAADFKQYIEEHQTDCIHFKCDFLLKGVTDPIKRSEAINSIIKSLSLIPDQIVRATYVTDCAYRLGLNEATLISTMNKMIRQNRDSNQNRNQPSAAAQQTQVSAAVQRIPVQQPPLTMATVNQQGDQIETMIIQMIIRHGEEIIFENVETDDGGQIDMNAAEYVDYDLGSDNLSFHNPLYNRVLREAVEHSRDKGFKAADYFTRHPDVEISMLAAQLTTDRVQISKSLQKTPEEGDTRIRLEHLVLDFRFNYVVEQLKKLRAKLLQPGLSSEEMKELITQINDMQMLRNKMARKLGRNDIIAS